MHDEEMLTTTELVVLCIVCIATSCNCNVIHPVRFAAPFTSVNFSCEGTGDVLTWIVKGVPINDSIKQQRDISVTDADSHSGSNLSSVLTITALPVNDGLQIACSIISLDPFREVFSVTVLTIRGVSPVEDLEFRFTSNNSLILTWSPPVFYSTDVPVGITVNYSVIVTIETGDPIVDSTISTTSIILANITQCDTFNVSVTASVAQYTSVTYSVGNSGSLFFDIEDYSVKLNQVPILFRVTSTPTQCNGTLLIEPILDGHNLSAHQLTVNGSNNPFQLIHYDLTDLDPFRRYNISIKLIDPKNAIRNEHFMSISTYHVQGFNISTGSSSTNGSVRVKCLFIEESTADGCHVIFNGPDQKREAFNITGSGSNERIVTLSVSGNYTVTAYDLVNGTIIGPSVEYFTPVEVIILPVSPVSATSSISSSSSISVISYKATSSTVSVAASALVSPTAPSNTPQATNGNSTVVIISITLLLLLLSFLVMVTVTGTCTVYVMTKRSRKKQATVTTNGEIALSYKSSADTNDYMHNPQLTNVFNFEAAPDQSVPLGGDPYFVHRHEFVPPPHYHPAATSIMEQSNAALLADSHPTSSSGTEDTLHVHDDGAAANNKHVYAEPTPATNCVPHEPPTGAVQVNE